MNNLSPKTRVSGPQLVLQRFWIAIWFAEIAGGVFQLIQFSQPVNLVCVLMCFGGCGLLSFCFWRQPILAAYPFSSLAVIGFGLTRLVLPLVFISLYSRPLIYEMYVPLQTFGSSLLILALFLIAHLIYRASRVWDIIGNRLGRRPLAYFGIFTPPSETQIWLIGGLGLVAQVYLAFHAGADQSTAPGIRANEGPLFKFIEGLKVFSLFPFLAVFPALYGGPAHNTRAGWLRAVIFFVSLLVASLATNSRSTFMGGLFTLALIFFWGILLGSIRLRMTPTQIFLCIFAIFLLAGPLKDLSNAMIIARGNRTKISRMELVELTVQIWFDRSALAAGKEIETAEGTISSTDYIDSPFLNRFCNVRYADTSIYLEHQIGESGKQVLQQAWMDHFLTTFPKPLIVLLHIPMDKDVADNASFGDSMLVLATGEAERLGSFATGDFVGIDYAVFGMWFLLVAFALAFPIFIFLDALTLPPGPTAIAAPASGATRVLSPMEPSAIPRLSPIGLLYIGSYLTILSLCESSENWVAYLVRYWWQVVILYAIIFKLTRFRLSK